MSLNIVNTTYTPRKYKTGLGLRLIRSNAVPKALKAPSHCFESFFVSFFATAVLAIIIFPLLIYRTFVCSVQEVGWVGNAIACLNSFSHLQVLASDSAGRVSPLVVRLFCCPARLALFAVPGSSTATVYLLRVRYKACSVV